MFYLKFDWLFGKSSSRKRTARTPIRKRLTRPLEVDRLEERTLLAGLLGTADSFAVLGGSTVTNTGPTVITGNLGVSPGSAVVGFPPGIVTPPATIHAADAVAVQAQSDVTIAFNDLAGRASNFDLTGTDLGGLTLTPAVYTFLSSAQLTGTLTLDAQGDPNAEFIFQIGSTITTASNASVNVINGADSCNVFWQVGSSATLGTDTAFVGNILALTSITLNTRASIVSGRALARNGAVTLDTNVVSIDGCATRTSSISGLKFNDLNGDGALQPGEPGLSGLTVFLDTNNNGVLDTGETSITTDANGNYSFSNLAPGTYRVREMQQAGFTQSTANPADVTLSSGQNVTGVNFGDFQNASKSGLKFLDGNGDGVRDPDGVDNIVGNADDEVGLPGFTINLTGTDGSGNAVNLSATTDANGNYSFSVAPGIYTVTEVCPAGAGWRQSFPGPITSVANCGANGYTITLSSGQVDSNNDFGNFQNASKSGLKFLDRNGDGVRDPDGVDNIAGNVDDERGLDGFEIRAYVDSNSNGLLEPGEFAAGPVATAITAVGTGAYSLTLNPGRYIVVEVLLSGFIQSFPSGAGTVVTNQVGLGANGYAITLTSGQADAGNDFGNFRILPSKLLLIGRNLSNLQDGTFAAQVSLVADLFQTLLGRTPNLAATQYYLRLLQAGFSPQQVATFIVDSGGQPRARVVAAGGLHEVVRPGRLHRRHHVPQLRPPHQQSLS